MLYSNNKDLVRAFSSLFDPLTLSASFYGKRVTILCVYRDGL